MLSAFEVLITEALCLKVYIVLINDIGFWWNLIQEPLCLIHSQNVKNSKFYSISRSGFLQSSG